MLTNTHTTTVSLVHAMCYPLHNRLPWYQHPLVQPNAKTIFFKVHSNIFLHPFSIRERMAQKDIKRFTFRFYSRLSFFLLMWGKCWSRLTNASFFRLSAFHLERGN